MLLKFELSLMLICCGSFVTSMDNRFRENEEQNLMNLFSGDVVQNERNGQAIKPVETNQPSRQTNILNKFDSFEAWNEQNEEKILTETKPIEPVLVNAFQLPSPIKNNVLSIKNCTVFYNNDTDFVAEIQERMNDGTIRYKYIAKRQIPNENVVKTKNNVENRFSHPHLCVEKEPSSNNVELNETQTTVDEPILNRNDDIANNKSDYRKNEFNDKLNNNTSNTAQWVRRIFEKFQ
ncbi:hypothetical protein PGB90_006975 [Kerria lacca]